MLKDIHRHIISELQQSSRTDTVFIISAVLYNLVILGICWGVASDTNKAGEHPAGNDFILVLLMLATVSINTFIVKALLSGKNTRLKLLDGLLTMYKDNNVDKYYDYSLLNSYKTRYHMFSVIIMILAAIAIIIPLIARLLN